MKVNQTEKNFKGFKRGLYLLGAASLLCILSINTLGNHTVERRGSQQMGEKWILSFNNRAGQPLVLTDDTSSSSKIGTFFSSVYGYLKIAGTFAAKFIFGPFAVVFKAIENASIYVFSKIAELFKQSSGAGAGAAA